MPFYGVDDYFVMLSKVRSRATNGVEAYSMPCLEIPFDFGSLKTLTGSG